ncbi:carotenoid oxygenase family protein [Aspergillus alliaceus]|uniref:carotenoid oxygenase family protein n=1 Tax=Petromyces alliaceus TaxID=209559 RepID=UPI0012A6B2E1|nr:carotenoid oxygenase [Aspergillus alliaceus]KAB8239757.1 carotenoid oxygenase [Aspergillus alliaceus]
MAQNETPRAPYNNWPNDAGFEATVEQREPIELPVTGSIPSRLAGTLYRTGPGTYKVGGSNFQRSHWFDGFTHLHRFQLVAQPTGTCKVLYNSRRQVDALIEEARKSGTLEGITFGQKRDPCESIFKKIKSLFRPSIDMKDPNLVNAGVTVHANAPLHPKEFDPPVGSAQLHSLVSLTDANILKHIDPETLEPLGVTRQDTLHPDLKGPLSCSHAAFDAASRDVYNYNLDMGRYATYRVFRTSATSGKTDILATVTGPAVKPAYLHSFFLSHNYVILCIWPCIFAAAGAKILWERNMVDALNFNPAIQTRWYVIDRRHERSVVATFLSPAFFSFHTINAWETNNSDDAADIMCDIIEYPTDEIIRAAYYENMVSTGQGAGLYGGSRPRLVRYRLANVPKIGRFETSAGDADLPRAEIMLKIEADIGDLPTINPKFSTKRTRYVYNVINQDKSSFADAVAKVDLETQEIRLWERERHTPGEAIFVPDGTDDAEDAGYLLSVVLNGDTGTSYLICLDARNMTEIGRADCASAVGFGFHGSHYPSHT